MKYLLSRDALLLHLVVLPIVAISSLIGIIKLPIGIATIILLPILYAFAMGVALNPALNKPMRRILSGSIIPGMIGYEAGRSGPVARRHRRAQHLEGGPCGDPWPAGAGRFRARRGP